MFHIQTLKLWDVSTNLFYKSCDSTLAKLLSIDPIRELKDMGIL